MSIIWSIIILFSFAYAFFNGSIDDVVNAILNSPNDALGIFLKIGGLIVVYNGLFHMAVDAKVIKMLGIIFKPFVKRVFKDIKEENKEEIIDIICLNMTANFLGLGLASTPIAIEALKKLNTNNEININMVLLLVINVSCFTFLPLTILSIRGQYNSSKDIIVFLGILIISFLNTLISVMIVKRGYR